jgi:DegV family protein with EDD domain
MLRLFVDSDCDFTIDQAKQLGVEIILMPYTINDETIYPYVDGKYDAHEYYDLLRSGVVPKTSALSPVEYINYFEPVFAGGDDILYVHFSKAMSGTFNSMNLALNELKEKYPERKFYTVDTRGISLMGYVVAQEVIKMYKDGKTGEEIEKWGIDGALNYSIYFYADDLKFFKASGRVSGIAAMMGGVLGIHPIIYMNEEGKMETLTKVKGKKTTLRKIISYIDENAIDIKNNKLYIAHGDAPEILNEFLEMIEKQYGKLDIEVVSVNPTAGAHCGPDVLGVCFKSQGR